MFDDPKRDLKWLEEELWAAEFEDEPEILEEEIPLEDDWGYADEDWLQEAKDLLQEPEEAPAPRHKKEKKAKKRNDAVDFHRTVFADVEMDENAAVFVDKKNRKKWKQQQKRSLGCLPFIVATELIGIAGLIWWWFRWLR